VSGWVNCWLPPRQVNEERGDEPCSESAMRQIRRADAVSGMTGLSQCTNVLTELPHGTYKTTLGFCSSVTPSPRTV
jgi:hypothetical protein